MNRELMKQCLDAAEKMRSGLIQMRENAEAYGEAFARAHVKEYSDLLPGSAEEKFIALNAMQRRMSDFADGVIAGYDAIQSLKAELAKHEPEQAALDWVNLQNAADEIVRNKPTWKRFIDGTPLANDIACWMADFALEYAAPTEPNCKFPTCHSQEYQDKLVQEILGQEPVAWLSTDCIGERYLCFTKPTDNDHVVPLYTKGK